MSRKKKKYQKVDYAPANFLRRLKQESFKKRRALIKAALILLIVGVGVKLSVGPFGTLELIRMHQKHRMLENKIIHLSTELTNLEWQSMRLANPFYIEKLARERFYMLKPGEIIIKLPADFIQQDDPS